MAGSQADPAALLRVLMKHGRMEQAAALALQYLRAWQTEVRVLTILGMSCQLMFKLQGGIPVEPFIKHIRTAALAINVWLLDHQ